MKAGRAVVLRSASSEYKGNAKKLDQEITKLKKKMKRASDQLEFEEAARMRDEIKRLEILQLSVMDGDVEKNFEDALEGKISS